MEEKECKKSILELWPEILDEDEEDLEGIVIEPVLKGQKSVFEIAKERLEEEEKNKRDQE